jgi:hypothetical protein
VEHHVTVRYCGGVTRITYKGHQIIAEGPVELDVI